MVGTVADLDYFSFTAGKTGTAQLHTTASHYLAPHWTVQTPLGVPIASQAAADASFSVVAGQRYYVALGTDDGIGYFQASFSASGPRRCSPATTTTTDESTRPTIRCGEIRWDRLLDLCADGDGNGTVDTADYSYWKQRYGQTSAASAAALTPDTSLVADTPEPVRRLPDGHHRSRGGML